MLNNTTLQRLRALTDFPALIAYLRDELDWPIEANTANIEDLRDITFDYRAAELGLDEQHAVKVEHIRQIRSLENEQPWGIFYIEFETRRLPVMVLRRILNALVHANVDRPAWAMQDLLFICVQGETGGRSVSFSHFRQNPDKSLPELRTFSWDSRETHFYYLAHLNLDKLRWPKNPRNTAAWREQWRGAFTQPHLYVIQTSKHLALELAKCAITIRELVSDLYAVENEIGALHKLLHVFQVELLNGLNAKDFADMIAQTISYGLFSAAASIGQSQTPLTIDTLAAAIPKTNPFLHDLFVQLTSQESLSLDELGVGQLIELLNSVKMADILHDFGRQTGSGSEDPVIHFYEEFLHQYDHDKKVERGVFYTPDPVVEYMVRAVDELLKKEFGLADGLASADTDATTGQPLVQILDPATGTGTFLAHIIDHIAATVKNQPGMRADKWNAYVRDSLLPRLNGFELMMAPYTIAHTKLGLKLQETGYDLAANDQRLRVFLTNALEPGFLSGEKLGDGQFLEREASEAGSVKRSKPIMVVIGNPPYSGTSQNNGQYISGLIRDYYFVDGQPLGERNPKWLQDDYVKFIRFGQERIADNGEGILAFITNHGYLDNPTFRGMRQQLMQTFDDIYIIDLHGNSKKKEVSPDGSKDENVFDIQQGVAIGIFIKHAPQNGETKATAHIHHQHLWGSRATKYAALLGELQNMPKWTQVDPQTPFYLLVPQAAELRAEYGIGWRIPDVMKVNVLGFQTHRDDFAIDIDRESLHRRIEEMRDGKISDTEYKVKYGLVDNRDWQLSTARKAIRTDQNWEHALIECAYRPFDNRTCYFSEIAMDYPRRELIRHVVEKDNLCLLASRQQSNLGYRHVWTVRSPAESCVVSTTSREGNQVFPLYLYPSTDELFTTSEWPLSDKGRRPNLSRKFVQAVEQTLGLTFITEGRGGNLLTTFGPEDVFFYAYAVFHSPTYRARYAEFLKIDFPRLPLTTDRELFGALCSLGNTLVALHLMDADDPGAVWNIDEGYSNPFITDLPRFVPGSNGTTVGTMRESDAYQDGRVYLDTKLKAKGSYFEGVPPEVWAFQVGGYQVCHKWLYDRRGSNGEPGRTLSDEDIAHYQKIVVALRETIRLMGEIDAVIEDYGGWPLGGSASPVEPPPESTAEVTELSEDNVDTLNNPNNLNNMQDEEPMAQDVADISLENMEDEQPILPNDQAGLDAVAGLDYEIDDEPVSSTAAFDPRKIRMTTQPLSLDILLNRIRDERIDLQPDFQRMAGVWDLRKKSRLIESLLIRIPLPSFYVDASNDEKWLIIDGLQRLTALREFVIAKEWKLRDMEFLKSEEGKGFDELERGLQRRIEETQVTVYMVLEGTPPEVKFNIFERINTGGSPLSAQEIRNALYQGKATRLTNELALSKEFQDATDKSIRPIRMADREIVLRFLAYALLPLNDSNDLGAFLNNTMLTINNMPDAEMDVLRQRFKRTMTWSYQILNKYAFRKIYPNNRRGTINRALFDAWAINFDQLDDSQLAVLKRRSKQLVSKFQVLLAHDAEFSASITYGTGDPKRVKKRFGEIKRIIAEVLNA